MKIVIAPNAFKGTITARAVAEAISTGVRQVLPTAEVIVVPVSDGGDGTLDNLVDTFDGFRRVSSVTGPTGDYVLANWGVVNEGQTALIETAQAMGMALVPDGRHDPATATSRGVGELILDALDLGIRDFIITLGGSATNDGGAAMARALGVKFLDSDGQELMDGGIALARLERIDVSNLDTRLSECSFLVLCDAGVPLTGDTGVSLMFSQGKGADLETAVQLDRALVRFSVIVNDQLDVNLADAPWAGAAGGLASSLIVFLGAELKLGIDVILDAVGLPAALVEADLVITGEGSVDEQTIYNKAPIGVAQLAKQNGSVVIAICANAGKNFEKVFDHGIDAVAAIAQTEGNGWAQFGGIVTESHITEVARDILEQVRDGAGLGSVPRIVTRTMRPSTQD